MREPGAVKITSGTDEGQECCVIETSLATYHYQMEAGGFSSICDSDGVDWVGFHPGEPAVPGGAANVFRGLPNLVHPAGYGHPGFTGCQSVVFDDVPQIRTASADGLWRWEVGFTDSDVWLAVTRTPAEVPYWFLYEGVPGGVYDPRRTFWGTPEGRFTTGDFSSAEICRSRPAPARRWTYFGAEGGQRVFCCIRCSPGDEDGVLYFMSHDQNGLEADDGMIVFGIGRGEGITKQLRGPQVFRFGFVESTNHDEIAEAVAKRLTLRNCIGQEKESALHHHRPTAV